MHLSPLLAHAETPSAEAVLSSSLSVTWPRGPVAGRAGVRRLEPRDIAQIADLFAATFRSGRKVRREGIEACLVDTYLTSPEDRLRPASLVDVDAGGCVRGFMGIITLGARFGHRRLRGGMLGNFMAREADRAKSGARLARATTTQDLDFVFTDTANRISLGLSSALKFDLLPLQSLEWVKLLRPCSTAAAVLGRSVPPLAAALRPLAALADMAARRLPFMALPDETGGVADRAIEVAGFVAQAPAFVERYGLRPDWTDAELGWLLDQAGRKTRNGRLQARQVLDRSDRTIGLFLIYAKPGAVAQVLQVLAAKGEEPAVLGAVIRAAFTLGAVAVRGNAGPAVARGLMRHAGVIYHHVASTIVFTRQPDLAAAFRSEDACLGGLFGEGWTRLVADEFS